MLVFLKERRCALTCTGINESIVESNNSHLCPGANIWSKESKNLTSRGLDLACNFRRTQRENQSLDFSYLAQISGKLICCLAGTIFKKKK